MSVPSSSPAPSDSVSSSTAQQPKSIVSQTIQRFVGYQPEDGRRVKPGQQRGCDIGVASIYACRAVDCSYRRAFWMAIPAAAANASTGTSSSWLTG
jgi:hypothetical protein